MAATPGAHYAAGGEDSACSTPFVSAPSSPARELSFSAAAAGGFYSAPASPARGGGPGAGDDEYGFDFDFDFSSQFPSPAAALPMSSADELFHNGQIRPMRLSSFLLRPQALPPLAGEVPASHLPEVAPAGADERGRLRSRSVHRRTRSHSPFRPHWLSPSSPPAPAANAGDPTASRSSSSSSTASSASSSSSSSSSHHRRWRFLKDLLHRSKSDGGGKRHPPPHSPPPPPAPKGNLSPPPARGRGGRRRSLAHARLYESRRAEAEEMRRRTFLPYKQGLLLGCLGLSSRGYGAMHGLAAAAAAKSRA